MKKQVSTGKLEVITVVKTAKSQIQKKPLQTTISAQAQSFMFKIITKLLTSSQTTRMKPVSEVMTQYDFCAHVLA